MKYLIRKEDKVTGQLSDLLSCQLYGAWYGPLLSQLTDQLANQLYFQIYMLSCQPLNELAFKIDPNSNI